jgi:hypothetical protein
VKTGESENEERPAETGGSEDAPKKMSKEERERIKAERRAAREAGKSLKKTAAQPDQGRTTPDAGSESTDEEAPKKEG